MLAFMVCLTGSETGVGWKEALRGFSRGSGHLSYWSASLGASSEGRCGAGEIGGP
jgi:hypothetical protein